MEAIGVRWAHNFNRVQSPWGSFGPRSESFAAPVTPDVVTLAFHEAPAENCPTAKRLVSGLIFATVVAASLVPVASAVALEPAPVAVSQAVTPLTALSAVPGAAAPADMALTWKAENPPEWRTFGHRAGGEHWFDEQGRWTDTETAVTADQAAAMSESQRTALANAAKIPLSQLRLGDASRVTVEAAIGAIEDANTLDAGKALKSAKPAHQETFGHRLVRGRLFEGRTWADSKTLVSADQAAAMPLAQRQALATSAKVPVEEIRLGDASRAVLDEAALVAAGRYDALAAHFPARVVTAHGFRMTARTAVHYERLLGLIGQTFPGRGVRITSTMGGRHVDPAHRQGRAVDFVVEPLSVKESRTVEKLAAQVGFTPYNEYVHSSPYKTGAHMHIALPAE